MRYFKLKFAILLSMLAFNSIAAKTCIASRTDYPYNTHQEPTPKKVQSNNRVYFYSLPRSECKTSTFVIKNDRILKYRESNGYSFVNFMNKNGAIVDGWIKSENIEADNEQGKWLTYSDFSWEINGKKVNILGKSMPELNSWIKKSGWTIPDPDNHGFNEGFESWTLNIKNQIVTISQANEIIEKRLGLNDTYVSGVTFLDDKYKTARGIKVGDDWRMVTSEYGDGSQINSENECRFYQYFDMKLSFCLDSLGKVQSILFEDYPVKP